MNSTRCLRLEEALDRLGGDRQLLTDLVQIYFEDSPDLLSRIRIAVREGDAIELTQAAHDLKGLLSNFSSAGATATAQSIERAARSRQLSDAARSLTQLERELLDVDETLRRWNESAHPASG